MARDQYKRIAGYCATRGPISVKSANDEIAVGNLKARISEMRRMPQYDVSDVWVSAENRYGDKIRYKQYMVKEVTPC